MNNSKPFNIPKSLVWQAYKLVKANKGASGIDNESIAQFEENLKNNLYILWNSLSSGTYFPPAVKGVEIPKKSGGTRMLGIPTVRDRIAQMVVKLAFEPSVEPKFLSDSYGYRPNKSALDAVTITRSRCEKYDWLLEFDIKGLFDNINHELLLKAVLKHTKCPWIILYIKRWLTAPMALPDGTIKNRTQGTPQGGVISPLLSNLFLHYVFDTYMSRNLKENPWCRYADDGIVHARSETQAKLILEKLGERFKECGLELHPTKTKIIYCKDCKRKGNYHNTKFNFLGYEFRARKIKSKQNKKLYIFFLPAISKEAGKSITKKIRQLNVRNRTELNLKQIAQWLNPYLNGWINYYGKFGKMGLENILQRVNTTLVRWSMRKFYKLNHKFIKAAKLVENMARRNKNMFAHWKIGVVGVYV